MSIFRTLREYGVVPVIVIDDPRHALPLADALLEGGLGVAEVTLRSAAALESIHQISRFRKEMLVGAGTVINEVQVDAIAEAGSRFALSPGIDRDVLLKAKQAGIPFAPGIATPSELQVALRSSCELVKFFPAMSSGGPDKLMDIAAPYLHTGIGFNPTGGVSLSNIDHWIAMDFVWAVGGSWIASREDIARGNWDKITENARLALAKVLSLRHVASSTGQRK